MSTFNTLNRIINIALLFLLLIYIARIYYQVRSLHMLDYIRLCMKHRQTIYAEMQRNPQIRRKHLVVVAGSLMILTFWVINGLQQLVNDLSLGNVLNLLITVGLFVVFLYQTWHDKQLNDSNRFLTIANNYQERHFDEVMAIFNQKLATWTPTDKDDKQLLNHFQRLFDQTREQDNKDVKTAKLSDDMYALFDDRLVLRGDSKPLTLHEKKVLSYYVGYWDAGPYNDYNLRLIEKLNEEERQQMTKVFNSLFAAATLALVFVAIRQIVV
ncbi:hypothetical protein [Lacticaseibacillus paracasei]|uniref:hypothetical protein n=1 Tax=Lacticaseibacillus paracasei TaxID=1597 RepID=UPI0022E3F6B6|nr:hypothetical protein [Lacticaseibacillus paracasei]